MGASKMLVERLMRENGIRARHKRRYNATTGFQARLTRRKQPAGLPLQCGLAQPGVDFRTSPICGPTRAGSIWPFVLDLFNREVIGLSIKRRMTADLVSDALRLAWSAAGPRHASCVTPTAADNTPATHSSASWLDMD